MPTKASMRSGAAESVDVRGDVAAALSWLTSSSMLYGAKGVARIRAAPFVALIFGQHVIWKVASPCAIVVVPLCRVSPAAVGAVVHPKEFALRRDGHGAQYLLNTFCIVAATCPPVLVAYVLMPPRRMPRAATNAPDLPLSAGGEPFSYPRDLGVEVALGWPAQRAYAPSNQHFR